MASAAQVGTKKRPFYGWWIVLAAALGWGLNSGLYFYGFGAYFLSLQKAFDVGRAAISGVISLARLEGGLLGPVEGYLVDRFGPRRIMLIGLALHGAGFILLSRVTSLVQFYVVFVLMVALGAAVGFGQPLTAALANWFIRRRGLAIGIASSGIGIGGLLVPGLAWLIAAHGWRTAAVVAGLTVWVVGFPIALVMRHRPEQYGELPDGASPEERKQEAEGAPEVDFTPFQALKTKAFWLLGVAFGLRVMVSSSMVIHLIPFLKDSGIPTAIAAAALGSLAITSVVGRVGYGWLGDRFDRRQMTVVALAAMGASMLIISWATEPWHIAVFFVLYAPSYGGLATMMHALRGDYFGRTSYATIAGFMGVLQTVGTMLGPVFAGLVFDSTKSYRLAFLVFALACFVSLALVALARRPILAEPRRLAGAGSEARGTLG